MNAKQSTLNDEVLKENTVSVSSHYCDNCRLWMNLLEIQCVSGFILFVMYWNFFFYYLY